MAERELFVSDGISGGTSWATYRRGPSGSLQRVKSPALPLRATRQEAEHDLAVWLEAKHPTPHQCYDCRHRGADNRCANPRGRYYGGLITMVPSNARRPCWEGHNA